MRALRGVETVEILKPDVNVVVSRRRAIPPPDLAVSLRSLPAFSRRVLAKRAELPAAATTLLEPLTSLSLRAALQEQVTAIAREYCDTLGYGAVDVTLECVKGVSCPRFHADVVEVRALCTLSGAGTLWVEDRHVDRSRLRRLPPGDMVGWSAIAHPRAAHVQQAVEGEVLYLKGSKFPGGSGLGAVHRSPDDVGADRPRLLLKLDPPGAIHQEPAEEGCGCGGANSMHHHHHHHN